MMTPPLMIDGKVRSSGKVLTPEQIKALLGWHLLQGRVVRVLVEPPGLRLHRAGGRRAWP